MTDENSSRLVRVMLVEDHASFRQALAFVLDLEQDFVVVDQFGSLVEARGALENCDFAIVDLALPDGSGIDLIEELRRSNLDVPVLILSATLDEENISRLVEAGASGVMDKLAGVDEIVAEAQRLRAGAAMPRQTEVVEMLRVVTRDGGWNHGANHDPKLTELDEAALRALSEGLDGEAVAQKLGMTVEQERDQVKSILEKLGAKSGLQALAIAASRDIVEFH